jgi:hypothetical protein
MDITLFCCFLYSTLSFEVQSWLESQSAIYALVIGGMAFVMCDRFVCTEDSSRHFAHNQWIILDKFLGVDYERKRPAD